MLCDIRKIRACVLVIAVLFLRVAAFGEVFVYDGFSAKHYQRGLLHNQNGGFGHSSWDGALEGERIAFVEPEVTNGLRVPHLDGIGGSAYGLACVDFYPSLAEVSSNGEPIYLSFIIDSCWKDHDAFHFSLFYITACYDPSDPEAVRNRLSRLWAGHWGKTNWVGADVDLGPPCAQFTPMHLVMELEIASNGAYVLTWFLDPPPTRETAIPFAVETDTNSALRTPYTRLGLGLSLPRGVHYCRFRFDELRLANSWEDLFRPLYGDIIVNIKGAGSATPGLLEMVPVGTVTNIQLEATNEDYHISLIRIGNHVVYSNASHRGIASTNLFVTVTNNITVEAIFAESRTANGIPLQWLTAHGISNKTDAVEAEDPDGDGLTNLQEWIAETDPTNPLSRFPDLLVEQRDRPVLVMEPVSTRRLLQIERKANLYHPSWVLWTSVVPSSARAEFPLPTTDTSQMFFRARVRLQD